MSDRVTFTRASAERIAQAVRKVEAGNRNTGALPTAPRFGTLSGQGVRFCSWSADWPHGETATITFDTSNNTETALNVVVGFAPGDGWVARNGTAGWHLIGADLTMQPAFNSTEIQLFGHDDSGIASWYSITTCATATA